MRVLAVLAVFTTLAVGCSGDKIGTASDDTTGAIAFKIDAATCAAGTFAVQLFIDGSLVGTQTMTVGTASTTYTARAGSHVVSATVANSSTKWAPTTITVVAGSTFVATLPC